MSLLVNATPVPVKYRDGSSGTIELGELSLRQLHRFIAHIAADDTPMMVAACCSKPIEWIDTLSDESYGALAAMCFNLNFQRAVGLMQSDPIVNAKLNPLCMALVRNAENLVASGMIGRELLPGLATLGSAAATGNESSISPQVESSSSSQSSPA